MRTARSHLLLNALCLALLGGCTYAGQAATPGEEPARALPTATSEPLRLTRITDLPGLPSAVTGPDTVSLDAPADDVLVAHDRVWVLSGGRLDAYDRQLNQIARRTVGSRVEGATAGQVLGAGGGSVWVGFALSDTLYRIDPDGYRVTATITAVRNPGRMAAIGEDLWVTEARTGSLTKVDLRTNRVVDVVPLGTSTTPPAGGWGELRRQDRALDPARVGTTGHLVWVEEPDEARVAVVDARTGSVVARHDCRGLSVVAGAPTATCGREVIWFDPTSAAPIRRRTAPEWLGVGPLNVLAADPTGGWVTAPPDKGIVRVDAGLRPIAASALSQRVTAARLAAFGDVVIGVAGATVFRLDPA